jgi:hypothetical protein
MKNVTKIVGAVAIAGVIAAGSSAFTAGGLSMVADESVSLGGTVSQSVTGEISLTDVGYTYNGADPNGVTSIQLTFGAPTASRVVTLVATGTSGGAVTFGCATSLTANVTCTATGSGYVGLDSIAVTIGAEV